MTSLTVEWMYCGNGDSSFKYTCLSATGADCASLNAAFPDTTCTVGDGNTTVTCDSSTSCSGGTSLLNSTSTYLRNGDQWEENRAYENGTIPLTSRAAVHASPMMSSRMMFVWILLLGFGFIQGTLAAAAPGSRAVGPHLSPVPAELAKYSEKRTDLATLTTQDLVEARAFFESNAFLEYILSLVSKFGQRTSKDILRDITSSDNGEKCTLILSPKRPWYKEVTRSAMKTVCTVLGDAISASANFSDWAKNTFLHVALIKDAEAACVSAVRTIIVSINIDIPAIYLLNPPTIAMELAVYLLADVACKATISAALQYSVGGNIAGLCNAVSDSLPWPAEITEQDGLPCKDEGIPVTKVTPATPPPDVVNPPSSNNSTSNSTGSGSNFDFAAFAKQGDALPCTTYGILYYIADLRSGHVDPRPYNRMLAPVFCSKPHHTKAEDTTKYCKEVCTDPCVSYESDVVDPFVKKYSGDYKLEWYDKHDLGDRCDFGTMYMGGLCEDWKAFGAKECRPGDDW